MPIYEYRCEECGESFDKFVRSILAETEVRCPKCDSEQVRKSFSLFASQGSQGTAAAGLPAGCAPSG